MKAFAPGPWSPHTTDMGAVTTICDSNGSPICRMVDEQDHAHARLIAAAPSLFEALRWALPDLKGYWREVAESAIARATEEQP